MVDPRNSSFADPTYKIDFIFLLRSSTGEEAYVTVFNSSATLGSRIPSSGVQVHAGYCRVFTIHRSFSAYMVFPMRVYTLHTRVGQRVRASLLTRKNSLFLLVLLMGFEPSTFGYSVQRSKH